jgi:hypothetical protein
MNPIMNYYAYARFYYEILWVSTTAPTSRIYIWKGDNVTIKTNSNYVVAWIEVWINGVFKCKANA